MAGMKGHHPARRGVQAPAPAPAHARHVKAAAALLALALLVIAGAAAAQVYKWKDEHGVVHYGDKPPARGRAEVLKVGGQAPAASAPLPYELARAAQASPVLLYTTARCDACDQGRALLRERGIPFAERTVNTHEDAQQLRQLDNKDELPVLLVGSRRITGFQAPAWQEALTAAAYPRQKMLPSGYRYAAPVPAAGTPPAPPVRAQIKVPPDEAAAQAAQVADRQPRTQQQNQPAAGNAPPDFQF